MQAQVKVNPKTIITVEAETQKDLFQQVSYAYEVFSEKSCGLCDCEDIMPVVRKVVQKKKEFEYPEYHCLNPKCRARLSLAYNMEGGTMFVNRELLESGEPATGDNRGKGQRGKHRGWTKWRGEPKDAEPDEKDGKDKKKA